MKNIENKTVAECVAENYKVADIFKKRGIDFCCGGKVLVKDVCKKKNINYEDIKNEIQNIDNKVEWIEDFNSWDLDLLSAYIINKHHKYVIENIPIISEYADKVAKVHGHYYTETIEINKLFEQVSDELTKHMCKEEHILFPYIDELSNAKKNNTTVNTPPFGTIQNPINMMEAEHEDAGKIENSIAQLSNDYTPPEEACNTYRVLYAKLKEFEDDLHQHIHLENNILFPKAIQLEKELLR